MGLCKDCYLECEPYVQTEREFQFGTVCDRCGNTIRDSDLQTELNRIKRKHLIRRAQGSANICSNCKHTGHFGSVSQYLHTDKERYLICGWCGHVEKI